MADSDIVIHVALVDWLISRQYIILLRSLQPENVCKVTNMYMSPVAPTP